MQMSLKGEISNDLKEATPYSFWVTSYTRNSGFKDTQQQICFQTACLGKGNA